ncbi:MAG: hypothetical protein ACLFVR_00250 [Thiohalospira sp.]
MKKKIIGGVIATLMFVSLLVGNVIVKSKKAAKAYHAPTTECALSGKCTVEGTSYTIEALN